MDVMFLFSLSIVVDSDNKPAADSELSAEKIRGKDTKVNWRYWSNHSNLVNFKSEKTLPQKILLHQLTQ